jgi:hypothetical protein
MMFANPMAFAGLSPAALAGIPPYDPSGQGAAGPSTLNLASPSMAAVMPMAARLAASAPARIAASPGPSIRVPDPSKMRPQVAAVQQGGMFGHSSKAANIALAILAGLEGFQAGRGVPGAAQGVANLQNAMQYRRQQDEANATMQQNYQALIARGMNPNDALIMAQYPDEMAKHIGSHFDQKVLNQGDTLATPDLSGSLQTYTAPDIQRNGADVVQSPGVQGVTAPFSLLPAGGAPQPVGAPTNIPGLRTDAEQYAASTGAQPGTPAYQRAIQDYTLKDHGPTAFGYNQQLQTQRLGVQQNIAYHHDATSAANNQRSTGVSAANNIRTTGQSNVNNLRSTQTSATNNQRTNARDHSHLPVMASPEQARMLPPGTMFKTPDGRVLVNP